MRRIGWFGVDDAILRRAIAAIQEFRSDRRERGADRPFHQHFVLVVFQVIGVNRRLFAGDRRGKSIHGRSTVVDGIFRSIQPANLRRGARERDDAILNPVQIDLEDLRRFLLLGFRRLLIGLRFFRVGWLLVLLTLLTLGLGFGPRRCSRGRLFSLYLCFVAERWKR